MPQRNSLDDDQMWSLGFGAMDEVEAAPPYSSPFPQEGAFDAQAYVKSLFRQPVFAPPNGLADAPDLRAAARLKFVESGLYGEPAETMPPSPPIGGAVAGAEPRNRNLAGETGLTTILGDDTASDPGMPPVASAAGPAFGDPALGDSAPLRRSRAFSDGNEPPPREAPAAASPPAAIAAPPAFPLRRPEAQAGLLLAAADTLLSKGTDWIAKLAGGNRAVVGPALDALVGFIGGSLPPEHRPSLDASAKAAATSARTRIDEREAALRNRAAISTLAGRRDEAEREHAQALFAGDPAKTAEARREAVQAWRAERLARGDSPAEANAGARDLGRRMRETALRHRLAQLDEAGIARALATDDDARSDPAAAERIAAGIRRIRREDPARAGEASLPREIETHRTHGRIDSDEEERRFRYARRWDNQARRGIPEGERRLLTNAERASLAAEYLRIEARQGQAAADEWLASRYREAGPRAARLQAELTAPQRREAQAAPSDPADRSGDDPAVDGEPNRAERAPPQRDAPQPPPRQYAEAPGTETDAPGDPDATFEAYAGRYRAGVRDHLRQIARTTGADADALIDDILKLGETARAERWGQPRRHQEFLALQERLDAATTGNVRLRVYLTRGAKAALDAAGSDDDLRDVFIKGVSGASPGERAQAEIARDEERDRRERQRLAEARYDTFKQKQPNAGYAERLTEIVRIARETGALPQRALLHLLPDLTPRPGLSGVGLADPDKVLAQFAALRAIAQNEGAAEALPQSLRDLAADYDAVARDPGRPRDPERFVRAVFGRGVLRRAQELAGLGETAAEILTPWGSVVSLDDARKAARRAYDAIAQGRIGEGLEQSGEALWFLAMAAPLVGNFRRGAKALRPRSLREMEERQREFRALGNEQVNYRLAPRDIDRVVPEAGTRIFVRQGDVIEKEILSRGVPKGFADAAEFRRVADGFRAAAAKDGGIDFGNVFVGLRGSALHGRTNKLPDGTRSRTHSSAKFDSAGPGKSDIDLFIVSEEFYSVLNRLGPAKGIVATDKLDVRLLQDLGLNGLAERLSKFILESGRRTTTIKVFKDEASLAQLGSYLMRRE